MLGFLIPFIRKRPFYAHVNRVWRRAGQFISNPISFLQKLLFGQNRKLVSLALLPVRKGFLRHDTSFACLRDIESWIPEARKKNLSGQNKLEIYDGKMAFHILPDALRRSYYIWAVLWLVFFIIGGLFYSNGSMVPANNVIETSYTLNYNNTTIGQEYQDEQRIEDRLDKTNYVTFVITRITTLEWGVAGLGTFILLVFAPWFIYVAIRRPVRDDFDILIPRYIRSFVNHSPTTIVMDRKSNCILKTSRVVLYYILIEYIKGSDKVEPIYWRNTQSIQEELVNFSLVSFITQIIESKKNGWLFCGIMFFFGAPIIFYFLLWCAALLQIYEPVFLGFVAFLWGIFSVVHINMIVTKIASLDRIEGAYFSNRIPTRVFEEYRMAKDLFNDEKFKIIGRISNVAISVLLMLFLTYL